MSSETGIGASVRRKEDQRFLTGKGKYVDDINLPGQTYASFVRSPHAHAKIKSFDTKAAMSSPGVVAVFTGADVTASGLGSLPCAWTVKNKDGSDTRVGPHPLLTETARFVGDCIAVVIAETLKQAISGATQLVIDYEILPAVVSTGDAAKPGMPQVHTEAENNIAFDWEVGDKAATDEAFANAHRVTKIDVVNNRMITSAIEPRAAVVEYDAGTERFTLYTTSQNPHVARLILSAFVGVAPEHKLRVVSPDVGGGFGSKICVYSEESTITWAARQIDRPIKWTAERTESFLSDTQGRDHISHAELAMDENGKFLGLRVSTTANLGAYPMAFGVVTPTYLYAILLAGQYATPAIYCEVLGVYTNTGYLDASRGAGRPEATFLIERIVEKAAREMGIDPIELRRRNLIPKDAFPYQTPVLHNYDSGDYEAHLDKAAALADYAGFAARREEAKTRGKLRGIGISAYAEACGLAPSAVAGALGGGVGLFEAGTVRLNATGSVTVLTGSKNTGQGHETAFAQIVSDKLGIPVENIDVVDGDTGRIPFGMGTYGSRSLTVGGAAIAKSADKVIEKGKKIAAHIMEASEADIEFDAGNFKVAGTDKSMSIGEIAFAAYVPHNYPIETLEPGLDETTFYDPTNFSFPAGTHICEVEVDPDTGSVEIVNYTAVDDFGVVVNPMIVEGQVHGGVTHGVGQALLEEAVYSASGQLVTGSYMDYCLPRADNVPTYKIDTTETPSPLNPLGVKGCGEAGAIAAPAAVMNAVTDALGTEAIDMPATPHKVWQTLKNKAA